ncbi:MAG: hypothetical protein GKC53_01045 [Neisseriaceae bacterium]|nr:MAG: hypothetical protein GKC53_01045 [Neisseriaceae bacterium]
MHFLFLSFILLITSCSHNDNAKSFTTSDSPKITSTLWQVSKAGEPVSYLLGSLHFGKLDDVLSNKILEIIQKSDYIYAEVKFPDDVENPTDSDFIEFMQKMYDMDSHQTLEDKIGTERFKKIKKMFLELTEKKNKGNSSQLNSEKLNYIQPWILPIYLPQVLVERNFSTEKGVDYLVMAEAKRMNIPIGGLENHMFRYYILKDKPMDLILNDIDQILSQEKMAEMSMRSMYFLYHSGDSKSLEAIGMSLTPEKSIFSALHSKETLASAKWLKKEMLDKRNLHWMPTILSLLPKQKNFFVVGLLHLYGSIGLIQQLREHGYTVTPISSNDDE